MQLTNGHILCIRIKESNGQIKETTMKLKGKLKKSKRKTKHIEILGDLNEFSLVL